MQKHQVNSLNNSKDSKFRMFVHYLYLEYREEHAVYGSPTPTLTMREWFRSFKYFIKQRYKDHLISEQRRMRWLYNT